MFNIITLILVTCSIFINYIILWEGRGFKRKQFLLNIHENSDSIFCIYNHKKKKIEYISDNVERLLGVSKRDLEHNFQNLLVNADPSIIEDIKNIFHETASEKYLDKELCFKDPKTNQDRWMRIKISPVKGKTYKGRYLFELYDINEVKKRGILLKEAILESQKYRDIRAGFCSTINRELKEPVNAINGMLYLALNNLNDPQLAEMYIKRALDCTKVLLNILKNNLDVEVLEREVSNLSHEVFNLNEQVYNIYLILKAQTNEKNINFTLNNEIEAENLLLIGDLLKLKNILLNLLMNAVKFTGSGGKINLNISKLIDTDSKKRIRFTISDTGTGISKEFLDKIYIPFEQEKRLHSMDKDGSGLGLSIVKHYVNIMNGTIDVVSKVDFGTTFTVDLPFLNGNQEASDEAGKFTYNEDEKSNYNFSDKRFIITDDNELNLEIDSEILKMTGAMVYTALSGQEAIDMFQNSPIDYYDVIFLDLRMPGLDGFETARIIRNLKREDSNKVKIVALSANSFTEDMAKALENGMDIYISKPIDIQGLYEKLKEL